LEDKTFKLKFPNAVKMHRTVEMFQWKENSTVHNSGESNEYTEFTYVKEWSTEIINSNQFDDTRLKNP